MDGRRSVIPSDTSDPVFSPPSTPIPADMREREDGYKTLKRRIYPEEMPAKGERM